MASTIEKTPTRTDVKLSPPSSESPSVQDVGAPSDGGVVLTHDEYHLATLGYKQEFIRCLGFFESWAATFTSMNFISGIPVLFGWVMYTGGPQAALANWTMVGGLSCIVSLVMAELAASLPTTGGIYFWSYRLGGEKYGPFLSWMTAWWGWAGWISVVPGVQQGSTNFLVSALMIKYPDSEVLHKGWFLWLLTSIGMIFAMMPNIYSPRLLQYYFRFAVAIFFSLFFMYWIWFPIKASEKHFNSSHGAFGLFYNGINLGDTKQASDGYCWVISVLFGAWVFYGYDASAHLAEETKQASTVVAKGIYTSTFSAWILSVPTLIIILLCLQDFDGIISATYANNWAEYLVQLIGDNGAVAILSLLWVDSTCATASCFMSAQRVTYAISRDGVLPFSFIFKKLSKRKMAVNAGLLVFVMSCAITTAVIGSAVAFSAITATATIATNVSYLIPIIARQTVGRKSFVPAKWNLGRFSLPLAIVASAYILFLFAVLLLPQLYPVDADTLNYAPICIGIITIISLVGWFFPKWGGRHWFVGPVKTITEEELRNARVQGGAATLEEGDALANIEYGHRKTSVSA
ncbi:Thiamine transporter thi9 [Cladophialophora carrionii]|uniref:Thiamine transporter thi9 n=1 Tax=Cladophialophora carrionii TaxID=86049 RepID=A0A1C1CQV1_9EURO|nr:Thiamine transporter thi9 [Cladophialophora carrionii]